MDDDRISFLPPPELEPLRIQLDKQIAEILEELNAAAFGRQIISPLMRSHLGSAFHAVGASEGTLWLVDRETERMVPVYNNGAQAGKMLAEIRHPVSAGLIGMVFSTQQSFCENEVYKNQQQDKRIDLSLGVNTCAMIAAPVFFARRMRGVVSCVRLKPATSSDPDPPGFTHREFRHIQVAAETLQRLIEHRLFEIALGSA